MTMKFDREIFEEMILYISEKCKDEPNFGSVLLNKILYYSDVLWFGLHGEAISGERYIRDDHGPRADDWYWVKDSLQKEGFLDVIEKSFHGKTQKRPVVKKAIEYNKLSKKQRTHIDEVISELVPHTASVVSEFSHGNLSWKYLENGEEIPYETVFFLKPTKKKDLTDKELKWADDVIEEFEASLKGTRH